jgi:hypothetical protein
MQGQCGEAYVGLATWVSEAFPALVSMLGARSVAEIAACSYIVGMEAPGLHSMFSEAGSILPLRDAEGGPGLQGRLS